LVHLENQVIIQQLRWWWCWSLVVMGTQ